MARLKMGGDVNLSLICDHGMQVVNFTFSFLPSLKNTRTYL
jgi:hypothetical protein